VRFLAALALAPLLSFAAPDEVALGRDEGYPLCPRARTFVDAKCIIGAVSRADEVYEARKVANGAVVRPLKRVAKEPPIRFTSPGLSGSLDDYLERNRTTGLLVMKGDTVLVERYQYDRKPEHRMNSYSMVKTVLAMMVGIALSEGKIKSLDDRVDAYLPELKGTAYGGTPLRHLLTMSSGIRFSTNYGGADDLSILARGTLLQEGPGGTATVSAFKDRERAPGQRYHYNSADSQVLGLVLRAATGSNQSDYLSEKIWQPMGAESAASWLVDKGGYETGFAFLNATVRDWGRFGALLANDGALEGNAIIPAAWVREATVVAADHLKAGAAEPHFGYGYQVRILPGTERQFVLLGQRGQALYVDPASKTVMVHTAARNVADGPGTLVTLALWQGVLQSLAQIKPD
jgi:CubicO group peptidase (beta-lactamase class C family)